MERRGVVHAGADFTPPHAMGKEYRKYKAPFPVASPLAPPRTRLSPALPDASPTPRRAAGRAPCWPHAAAGRRRHRSCLGLGDRQERHHRLLQAAAARGAGCHMGALGAAPDSSAMTRAARHVFLCAPTMLACSETPPAYSSAAMYRCPVAFQPGTVDGVQYGAVDGLTQQTIS